MQGEQVSDDLSLEQIEDDYWGDPPADTTRLIATVHQLRRRPIGLLEAEDLRLLLSQQVGVDVLLPRALVRLGQNPLLEGDFYPGDVLVAALRTPRTYWQANPDQLAAAERIIVSIRDLGDLEALGAPGDVITECIEEFHQRIQA